MKLTLNLSTFLQLATWCAAILSQALSANIIPEDYKHAALVAAGLLSTILHFAAGQRNPDGSPVALPYSEVTGELMSAAEAAYEAYRAQAGGKSLVSGAALPGWPALMPAIQQGWIAAAGAAQVHVGRSA